MSNLKPLVWSNRNKSKTPFRSYHVCMRGNEVVVLYESKTGEPATGFASIEDAKHWAEHTHYAGEMQQYVRTDSITDYFDKFTQWGLDRGIIQNGNVLAQGLKLGSEKGELDDNLAKGRCIKDDIGDCMVVLNMLAQMQGLELEDCLAQAWGDIKDRKGFMNEHGVFIKESDCE